VSAGALAIHPGALGDVLLAVPALRALRARHGALALAARPHVGDLLAALGEVDGTHDVESLRLATLFSDEDGGVALPDADRVVCWFGARDPTFAARLRAHARAVTVAPSTGAGLVWQHLLATCDPGARACRRACRVDAALRAAGREALRAAGWEGRAPLVVVQPGAGGPSKRWPAEGFAAALAGVDRVAVVVHEGPPDAAAVRAFLEHRPEALVLRDPSLPALAGALAEATLYVGNDSGVSHLAAAVGVRAVIVFAEANLAWRPWPTEPDVFVLDVTRVRVDDVARVGAAVRRGVG
jgi:hypothetical protein